MARRDTTDVRPAPVRRQRGLTRIALILDAAAAEFAVVGFDKTTTNSIAARAGISPGSLYQYFDDKVAIAAALAQRYVEELVASQAGIFGGPDTELVSLSTAEAVEQILGPLITFNVKHPAFLVLFARNDVPELLAAAVGPLESAFADRIAQALQQRNPQAAGKHIDTVTEASILMFRGLMTGVSALSAARRRIRAREAKAAITAYLQYRDLR